VTVMAESPLRDTVLLEERLCNCPLYSSMTKPSYAVDTCRGGP
jgi:hypothetical protein